MSAHITDEAILAELEIVQAEGKLQSLRFVTDKAGIAFARAVLALAAPQPPAVKEVAPAPATLSGGDHG